MKTATQLVEKAITAITKGQEMRTILLDLAIQCMKLGLGDRLQTVVRHTTRKNKPWEEHELTFAIESYQKPGYTAKKIGAALGRTPASVTQCLVGLKKRGLFTAKFSKYKRNGPVTTVPCS